MADVYRRYQGALRRAAALDFDDLIAEVVRLFLDHPQAGERWSRRFRHVLVDEYQDTNHAQFRLVQSLAAVHGNVFVVGDDDQSIYGWRGADLANVLDFERAFPGAQVIRLEQNYRSTRNILAAANAVIANNVARKGKTLWSEREPGPPLRFVLAADDAEEARQVRRFLERQRGRGRRLADCAVLYRTNAQSRALETELRAGGIAYEIVGGVSFYQRREVKDLLAYLRLVVNPADTASFWRAWNTPRRGLGPAVRAQVEARLSAGALGPLLPDAAAAANPVDALRALAASGALARTARTGAAQFLALLDALAAKREGPLEELFGVLLESSGYLEHLEASSDEDLAERRANVEELAASAAAFAAAGGGGLLEYLSETALLTDADRVSEDEDRTLLLTAHNAKGLEFDAVAVAGLEEGLLPHASSRDDAARLEEERRLFYVALTRARDEVLLTAAAWRRRFDGGFAGQVSRFVEEIPAELLDRDDLAAHRAASRAGAAARPAARWGGGRAVPANGQGWTRADEQAEARADLGDDGPVRTAAPVRSARTRRAVGRVVVHDKFGRGTVVDAEGEGEELKLTVRFAGSVKKVFARFVQGADDVDPA
jgi:DNA helicase-2/ATP-dependent DNA helicase PcrA